MTAPAPLDEDKQIGPQLAEFPEWLRALFLRTGSPPDLLEDLAMLAIPTGTFGLDLAQIGGRPAGAVRTQALLDLSLFKGANRVFLAAQDGPRMAWADVMRAQPLGFVVLIVHRDGIDPARWQELKACGLHIDVAQEPSGLGVVADRGLEVAVGGLLGELLGDAEGVGEEAEEVYHSHGEWDRAETDPPDGEG